MIVKTKYIRNYTLLIIKSLCQHHLMRHCTNKRHYLKSAAIQGQFCCISASDAKLSKIQGQVRTQSSVLTFLQCDAIFCVNFKFSRENCKHIFSAFLQEQLLWCHCSVLIKISWNWRSYELFAFWQINNLFEFFPPYMISLFLTRWCKVHAFRNVKLHSKRLMLISYKM